MITAGSLGGWWRNRMPQGFLKSVGRVPSAPSHEAAPDGGLAAASRRFDGVRLRAAIVARGWTGGEFAADSRISRACLYKALAGVAVSDRTVVRVVKALGRSPTPLLDCPRVSTAP